MHRLHSGLHNLSQQIAMVDVAESFFVRVGGVRQFLSPSSAGRALVLRQQNLLW